MNKKLIIFIIISIMIMLLKSQVIVTSCFQNIGGHFFFEKFVHVNDTILCLING